VADPTLEVEIVTQWGGLIAFGPVPVQEGLSWVEDLLVDMGHQPEIQMFSLHMLRHLRARQGEFHNARDDIANWRTHLRELGREEASSTSRSEEHTSELQSLRHLVCRLLLEK